VVVESPPNTLGMVNDSFFRYVADLCAIRLKTS
jgi:hypothetical protein